MTREREIERVLEQWFTDGPTQMPDHLFNEVFDRIDRTPQPRLARLQTRFRAMNANLRLAAAAAIIVVVGAAGALFLTRSPGVGVTPSPQPTVTASPAASSSPLPATLMSTWVGATRTVPQITPPIQRSVLKLNATRLSFLGGGDPLLFSSANLASENTIAFKLNAAGFGCNAGDVGTYTFALSGKTGAGGLLSLDAVNDPCAARVAAISGDWIRTACTDVNGWCLGNLEAGDYQSLWLNPWVVPSAWVSRIGALTYTVPAGWRNPEDCDGCFMLDQQAGPANTGIYIWDDVVAHSQADRCSEKAEPGVGRTAAALTEWLHGLPGLDTTTPEPVTIGGLSGFMIDLAVAPSWTATCPYADPPGRPLVSTFVDATPGGGFDWNIQSAGLTRVIALDIGDGRALVIDIEAQTKADYDALLPEAMQVVQSFQFHP
jgi:hypothetical protein